MEDSPPNDPEDIFEIEDFFIASNLERLIVLFDDVFHEILPISDGRSSYHRELSFANIDVNIDLSCSSDLVQKYGEEDDLIGLLRLPQYIVLSIRHISPVPIDKHARYVLSSACMAASSSIFPLPVFISLGDSSFIGRSLSTRYHVEMRDWDIPQSLRNLSGVLGFFNEMFPCRIDAKSLPMVSVKYSYRDEQFMLPPNAPCGGIHLDTNTCWGSTSSHRLLFHLDVHWTPFPEGTFVSDSIFSDLIPISAPIWRLFCRLDPGLTVSLSSRLRQFLSICRKCSSFESVQAIALLDHSFTPLYILDDQVHDIFSTDALGSYAMASTSSIKSCPFLSILSKLVLVMAQQPDDEPHRIAQLYNAFVNELQRHWDHALPLKLPISDPSEAIPDLSTCILYQKIQVLAHCISLRTVAIENRASATISPSAQRASDWVDFDGYSGVENLEECSSIIGDSRGSADVAAVPEGINHDIFLSDMFLLEGGQQMHVPLTLESPLMTEDEVDAQHALMAGLGTDHESSSIRAEMQSASLLSDMSAFKAANPACVLEDFIRWYSPNDWVEGKGLSRRMSGVNNLWRKCWSKAVACPASRQKPLFDYIAQGERILDYFRTINPAALMQQIESVAIGNAAHVIGSAFMILGDMPRTRRTVAQLFTAESNSNVVAHIEKVERMACLMQRLPSNMIRLPLIDDILHDNVAMIMADTDRQLLLDGMDEKFRNLSLPDQRRYTVVNDIEESVVVEIEGGTPAVFGDQGGIDPDRIAIATASSI